MFALATSDDDRCENVAEAGGATGTRCMLKREHGDVHLYGTCPYERTPEQQANFERYVTGVDRQ